ncbi:hypothetical protein PV11_09727 [Exophiala sideris]|uniref:Transcription factor domain-containing protein n=1 Tax=Exophiala sideris TaxID=1016849 RepID=A0A0D1YAX4_9EURO|nr:hypothetical protein PV11_09727 [Exophiala sideris]
MTRDHQCPGYQRPLKWSTKYEIHKNKQTRTPSASGLPLCEKWPSADDQVFSAGPGSGSRATEQTMPATLPPSMLTSRSFSSDFTGATVIYPDEGVVASHLSGPVTGSADMSMLAEDAGHTQQDFEESVLWTSNSPWLNDLQLLETFNTVSLESYKSTNSAMSPVDDWSVQIEQQSPEETEQHGEEPSAIAHGSDHDSTSRVVSQTGVRLYHSSTPQTLTHVPTFLIEYWFNTVCATWNGFDSVKNMNRKVALETFQHSEGLAYNLQSMAAAYLAEHLPHFRETTVTMIQAAVHAIKKEVNQRKSPHTFPRDLLLSMFCIGTSACWTDPLQFGLPFLKEIKGILRNYNPTKASLSSDDQTALAFFNNSCLYWDMLCSIIGTASTGTLEPGPALPSPQDALHPWTGVSSGIFVLFSESISLCRRFRARITQDHRPTTQSLRAALRDIEEAQNLHRRVEEFFIPSERDVADTGDELTPKHHLVQIAEAYRLAALAHCRQTFSDLTAEAPVEEGNRAGNDEQVLDLGLGIIRILEKIPLTSGTRCIQPLLCLTAGTVLKLDVASVEPQQQALTSLGDILSNDLRAPSASNPTLENPRRDAVAALEITKRSIEVGEARRFVLERFSLLESSLPPKPIRVAKQLVQSIWAAYDNEGPGTNEVHWIDVMTKSNLRTIFG